MAYFFQNFACGDCSLILEIVTKKTSNTQYVIIVIDIGSISNSKSINQTIICTDMSMDVNVPPGHSFTAAEPKFKLFSTCQVTSIYKPVPAFCH